MILREEDVHQMGKMLTNYNNLRGNNEMKEYQASIKSMYWVLGVAVLFYYGIPYIIILAFHGLPAGLYGYLAFNVFPFYAFMGCFMHSRKHNVIWYIPVMTGLIYLPTVLIYNCAWQYAFLTIVYVALGYFGTLAGYLFIRRKKKRKAPIGANYAVKKSRKRYEKKGK